MIRYTGFHCMSTVARARALPKKGALKAHGGLSLSKGFSYHGLRIFAQLVELSFVNSQ